MEPGRKKYLGTNRLGGAYFIFSAFRSFLEGDFIRIRTKKRDIVYYYYH